MAQARSKRRSRKQRRSSGNAPRAVPSARREQRAEREAAAARQSRTASRQLGTAGERPPGPFGGLPVSEAAIAIGMVGVIVGFVTGGVPAMVVGAIVVGLGVLEVTAREHFSGFRSHTLLLSGVAAVAVETVVAIVFGVPSVRILVLAPAIPVFVICFVLLRRQFSAARHTRVTRPPAP